MKSLRAWILQLTADDAALEDTPTDPARGVYVCMWSDWACPTWHVYALNAKGGKDSFQIYYMLVMPL
ncbi:hypothetical protein GJAV_G00099460 [Gymnothorax javanicus]|nr:hypothetical protein GJAV_G00099460 [Gymnothorax javanicus]